MTHNNKITRFLSYFKPHRGIFIADMLCAFFIAFVDLFFPLLTRYALDDILPTNKFRFFLVLIGFMCILYIVRMTASYFVTYLGHTFGVDVETDMRRDIFKHIQEQPFRFFDNHRRGKLMSRLTTDLFDITELAHHGPEDLFISIVTLVGSFILMIQIKWQLALVVFAFIPPMIIHTAISRKKLSSSAKKVKEEMAEINTNLESSISGARVTKIFTNEDYEIEKFAISNRNYYGKKKKFYKAMAFFHCRLEFFMQILNVVVIGAGGILIMKSNLTMTDLITATLYIAAFLQPIRRLATFIEQYSVGMAGFNRFVELMDHDEKTVSNPGALPVKTVKGDISYKNLSFSYSNDVPVLENINLDIKAGETIAFVGQSGGGKTTLCNLLPRFYDFQQGDITLDNKSIKDIELQSLREQIGLVQQDVFMFAGTIKENIAYGKIGSSKESIIKAAKLAEIHEDILAMPNGYDTVIGERGIKLSGGQKQRVSIARIFLKNPPILILDEATSALDTATEIKIQRAFDRLAKGRTTLVIAHRLSTIQNADVIAVINDKNISEIGRHEELVQKGGIYKTLHDVQFKNT